MIQRLLFPAALALLLSAASASSQDFKKTSDLPLFQALSGKRTESGILIVAAANQPFQGSATSVGQPFLGGLWFQIEGSAAYGPTKWAYRWSITVRKEGDRFAAYGTYLDTTGQKVDYQGFYDTEAQRVQLIAKMKGGTGRFQMTLLEEGKVRIESVNSDEKDNPVVTYTAENVAAE